MNHGPLIFLGALLALVASWFGFIVQPQLQLGRATPETNIVDSAQLHPVAPAGLVRQGAEVYRSLGCAACHTRQVRQDGVVFDVVLSGAGTNAPAVAAAIQALGLKTPAGDLAATLTNSPLTLLEGVRRARADEAVKALTDAGGKAAIAVVPTGPDITRGWGKARSVAADYLYETPALLGSQRIGPDLSNIGLRMPSAEWHLQHLYAPRSVVPNSAMPPYRFLFETLPIRSQPAVDALKLPPGVPVAPGFEVVPTAEARALVAYLLSLRGQVPLLSRPMSGWSAPATGTTTNGLAVPTNAPSK
jgi:cbb3-type cytochrome oxidase cytochrome c subunit